MSRHPTDPVAQFKLDYDVLLGVARQVLAEHHGVQFGELERSGDIVAALVRAAPALPGDCAVLLSLDQKQSVKELVTESLRTLRSLDPHLFAGGAELTIKRVALITARATGNTDWQSVVTNVERDSVDIRRRGWHQACLKLISQGRESEIPTLAEAEKKPDALPPNLEGGVSASRRSAAPTPRGQIDGRIPGHSDAA